MNFFEKTTETNTIYKGKIFNVQQNKVLLKNGNFSSREVIKKQNAACIVALTKTKKIVMVKQFRYAINRHLLEIPAGKIETFEKHPIICAKRELLEETGYKAKKWINLGPMFPCPGFCNEKLFLFLAINAFKAQNPTPDPDEFLQTVILPFKLAIVQAAMGNLHDAKTSCAILKLHALTQLRKMQLN